MNEAEVKRRPTSIAEMQESLKALETEESRQRGHLFQPKASDIIISPYEKSGTTWVQQIAHGLRTRGDMDFDDISRVAPWIENAHDLGQDLNAPQRGHPRLFKSHLSWYDVPKGGCYIVPVRDPKDVVVSYYRFLEGWFFEPGSISITTWANEELKRDRAKEGYWHHLISWWEQRHRENVLLLCYENMKTDLPGTIRRIAQFMGIGLDASLFDIVLRQSSFQFMLAHKDKFDDRLMRERSEAVLGLPIDSDAAKVRKGEVGAHRYELPPVICQAYDQIWREEIEARLGFASYRALQVAISAL
ncbi:MAG: sulfotransferase domain-containing protein [Caldilineaceae bacterium]